MYGKLSQHAHCPLTKLSSADAIHTIAYTNNRIEIVKLRHIFLAIGSSFSLFQYLRAFNKSVC